LVDSPSGQAAWILEKFWAWTDCDGHPENVLTRDELLDNIMMYWLTGTAASSARLYWESFGRASLDEVHVPSFPRLVYWNELDRGGHFAAFERPETFVSELRACFSHMR
jgi:hypothetical protein